MSTIVVISVHTAPGEAVLAPVAALRAAGHRILLVSRHTPSEPVYAAFDEVLPWPKGRLSGLRVRKAGLVVMPDRLPAAHRIASLGAVRDAEVLIAAEPNAIPAVWWAARRSQRKTLAINGFQGALGALLPG